MLETQPNCPEASSDSSEKNSHVQHRGKHSINESSRTTNKADDSNLAVDEVIEIQGLDCSDTDSSDSDYGGDDECGMGKDDDDQDDDQDYNQEDEQDDGVDDEDDMDDDEEEEGGEESSEDDGDDGNVGLEQNRDDDEESDDDSESDLESDEYQDHNRFPRMSKLSKNKIDLFDHLTVVSDIDQVSVIDEDIVLVIRSFGPKCKVSFKSSISRTRTTSGSRFKLATDVRSADGEKIRRIVHSLDSYPNVYACSIIHQEMQFHGRIYLTGVQRRVGDTNMFEGVVHKYFVGSMDAARTYLCDQGAKLSDGTPTKHPAFTRMSQFKCAGVKANTQQGKPKSTGPASEHVQEEAKDGTSMEADEHSVGCSVAASDAILLFSVFQSILRSDIENNDDAAIRRAANLILNHSVFVAQQAGTKDAQILGVWGPQTYKKMNEIQLQKGHRALKTEKYYDCLHDLISTLAQDRINEIVPHTKSEAFSRGVGPAVSMDVGLTLFHTGGGRDGDAVDPMADYEHLFVKDDDEDAGGTSQDYVIPEFINARGDSEARDSAAKRGFSLVPHGSGIARWWKRAIKTVQKGYRIVFKEDTRSRSDFRPHVVGATAGRRGDGRLTTGIPIREVSVRCAVGAGRTSESGDGDEGVAAGASGASQRDACDSHGDVRTGSGGSDDNGVGDNSIGDGGDDDDGSQYNDEDDGDDGDTTLGEHVDTDDDSFSLSSSCQLFDTVDDDESLVGTDFRSCKWDRLCSARMSGG